MLPSASAKLSVMIVVISILLVEPAEEVDRQSLAGPPAGTREPALARG
jgi:hypothetical protein